MLGFQVCWQLLLGWALLLGQPVCGDSDAEEEPPLAESEGPVPVPQEPEDPVPVPQEPEDPVPVPQEPEEPVSVPQEPEEPLSEESVDPRVEDMIGRPLTSEEIWMLLGPSDEELERKAERARQWLEKARDDPYSHTIQDLKEIVLQHYNQKSNYIYTQYENGNIKIKKAIGTTTEVTLLLVKTNCTKEEGEAIIRQRYSYDDDDETMNKPERKQCKVPPASEQEEDRTRILSS
ncbi:UNVERIFIED_CONTAM: hypothetical protein K2H54_001620 [Gekko kuhli]